MTAGAVLIVDDDAHVQQAYRRILERARYRVHLASSVRECDCVAIEHLCDLDAAVVDFRLPDGNGPDCVDALRRRMTHRLGILMCTGVCPELASQAVLDQCFEAYGEKPMSSSELLSKTALVVAVGRLRRAVVRALSRGTRAPTYTEGARAADSKDLRTRLAAEVRRAACSVGSVECFAGLCGVSTAQLYRVLNCETSPTLDWLERVAASGGVELARVIRDAED